MKRNTSDLVIRGLALTSILAVGGLASTILASCDGDGASTGPPTTFIPTTIPSTAVELVDQGLRELDWGSIAFNAAPTMRYAQPQSVELLLSPSLSATDLEAQLQQSVGAESEQIRISNRMEAQLTGSGFTIEALTPGLQAVTSQQVTRWEWEVTPTGQGRKELHLTLSAYIDLAGSDAPLVVRTYDREIQVDITVAQRVSGFLRNNWQWLWAAIVVPVAGFVWTLKKRRGGKPEEHAGSS